MDTKHKAVTSLTKEGYIVDNSTGGVIGYKCTRCSTAHIHKDLLYDIELFAMAISEDIKTHRSCL